ncbi:hypothetical protein [Flagellimonas meishanensis]|uniref:hypothetical protein n=1 Tax=Flagellimonas meishanensis TaxID=2873264 RepID=UPI001CA6A1D8|nr:hypothetical protein [[Muricauda] meishanensis]
MTELGNTEEFDQIFATGSNAHNMGLKLRKLITQSFDRIEENIIHRRHNLAIGHGSGKSSLLVQIELRMPTI